MNTPKNLHEADGLLKEENKLQIEKNTLENMVERSVEKEVNIETGDIVLFPSSVFHKTLPFDSLENRVTLAFDIKPLK